MKKIFITIILIFLNSLYSSIYAYEVEYKGLKYRIDTKTMSAILIKGDKEYSGKIIIPNEIVYNSRSIPVTEIAKEIFSNCKLTSLIIPASVQKLNSQGDDFYVDDLIIQDSQESLTYYNGKVINAKNIYIGRTITFYYSQFENGMFYGPIEKVIFGNGEIKILSKLFRFYSIENIKFGNNMKFTKNLCEGVKFSCPIILPDNVKELPKYGLGLSNKIPSIILPNSLEIVPYSAFNGAYAKDIKLGNKTKEIGNYAFFLNDITYIEIPSTIEKIGDEAFGSCHNLKSVYIRSKDPTSIIVGPKYDAFSDETYIDGTLFVPKGTINLYKKHESFSKFFNIIEHDGTSIDNQKVTESAIRIDGKEIHLNGFTPKSTIKLYNVKGELINTYEASEDGNLTIPLSFLNKGVYLIKANKKIYKFCH